MTTAGDRRKLFKHLQSQGCRIAASGRMHYIIFAPDGRRIASCPSTPSDWRAMRNMRARLRQEGISL